MKENSWWNISLWMRWTENRLVTWLKGASREAESLWRTDVPRTALTDSSSSLRIMFLDVKWQRLCRFKNKYFIWNLTLCQVCLCEVQTTTALCWQPTLHTPVVQFNSTVSASLSKDERKRIRVQFLLKKITCTVFLSSHTHNSVYSVVHFVSHWALDETSCRHLTEEKTKNVFLSAAILNCVSKPHLPHTLSWPRLLHFPLSPVFVPICYIPSPVHQFPSDLDIMMSSASMTYYHPEIDPQEVFKQLQKHKQVYTEDLQDMCWITIFKCDNVCVIW